MNEYEKALNDTEEEEKSFIDNHERIAIATYIALKSMNNNFFTTVATDSKLDLVKVNKSNLLSSFLNNAFAEIDKLKLNKTEFDGYLRNVADINFKATKEALDDVLHGIDIGLTEEEYSNLVQTIFKDNAIDSTIVRGKLSLSQKVRQSIASGDSINDLNKSVKKVVEGVVNGNETIITTQTTKTMNHSRITGLQKANSKIDDTIEKIWVSRRDEKVRASHKSLDNGISIPLDEAFDNGLMYPGDPTGDASEVIRCRCELEHVVIKH